MKFNDYLLGDVVVIELTGMMLGGAPTTMLRGCIQEYLTLGKKKIVLDLEGVKRVNSVGLGVLLAANNSIATHGGQLLLANITRIESLLTMTRLIHQFRHTDNRMDAIKTLRYH